MLPKAKDILLLQQRVKKPLNVHDCKAGNRERMTQTDKAIIKQLEIITATLNITYGEREKSKRVLLRLDWVAAEKFGFTGTCNVK